MIPASERFGLDTSRIVPRSFVLFFDSAVVLLTSFGVISLALQRQPAAILFVIIGVLMISGIHLTVRAFANPDKNFVQLENDHFRVEVSQLFRPIAADILYTAVERVEDNAGHLGWWPFGYWPYSAITQPSDHVHVSLRQAKLLGFAWGRMWPWVRVIHLDVIKPEGFVAALNARVAGASLD